jgi:hypothetical protein
MCSGTAENTGGGAVGLNADGRAKMGVGLGDSRTPDAFVLDVRMGDADFTVLWRGISVDTFKISVNSAQ